MTNTHDVHAPVCDCGDGLCPLHCWTCGSGVTDSPAYPLCSDCESGAATATYRCTACEILTKRGIRTGTPPYHGPDDAPRRFAIGDQVTVPAQKCPACDHHHGITDWTGTVVRFEHPFHAGPADMGIPGPYYLVDMADGQLVYGESQLTP